MKLGGIPQNPVELTGAILGLLPVPLLDTHVAILLARAVMEGTRLGVFDSLAGGPLTAEEIAARCGGEPRATRKLLEALAGCEYLRFGAGRYSLTRTSRKWLLADAGQSLRDKMLLLFLEWDFLSRTGDFLNTGRPLDFHASLTPEEWGIYQRGMRATVSTWVPEVARRTPVPKGARDFLDIGGSHGLLSAAICRRHPGLHAVILDLAEAVEHAAPLLAREEMGDRVVHRIGNTLTDDLGTEAWDVVFVSNLVHHFDEATNRALAKRVARSLRPGGVFVIQELFRPRSPGEAGQIGALLNLYFALTSQSGTWTFEEMAAWQREAGLVPRKPLKLLTAPGTGQQSAAKKR
ncbi:MAG TPA: class I SAM-dependent methyltransferase [Thermoanaerobaculia bacterium]|nr:class I SAM-dependent methyltransferase [Thermoanaerobaculia bacterium]